MDWEQLWSFERTCLGLSEEEFWRLTFRESHLLAQAYWQRQKRAVLPQAMLLQLLANVHRDTHERRQAFSLPEVLEWLGFPAAPVPPPPRATPDEIEARIALLHSLYTQVSAVNGEVSPQ